MELILNKEELNKISTRVGNEIDNLIKDESKIPVIVGVMKGSMNFMMDVLKHVNTHVFTDYIQVSSYNGTKSTGKVILKRDFEFDVRDRVVVLIEDVIDTGISMNYLLDFIKTRHGPKKIILVALFDKICRRKMPIKIDIIGKVLNEDKFLYGYGLDFQELGRNLPEVYSINSDEVSKLNSKINLD